MKRNLFIKMLLLIVVFTSVNAKSFAGQYNVYTTDGYSNTYISDTTIVELVVDYSSSMRQWLVEMSRALEVILPKISTKTSLAFRTIGGACDDYLKCNVEGCKATQQVNPLGKNNNAAVIKSIRSTRVGGMTPLTLALQETIENDLSGSSVRSPAKKRIVLVTDGYESCGGDPCAYIKTIVKTRKDIQIDVIQVGNRPQLMCLTAATGGKYFVLGTDSDSGRSQLEDALEQSFGVPKGTVREARKISSPQKPSATQRPVPQPPARVKGYKFINN